MTKNNRKCHCGTDLYNQGLKDPRAFAMSNSSFSGLLSNGVQMHYNVCSPNVFCVLDKIVKGQNSQTIFVALSFWGDFLFTSCFVNITGNEKKSLKNEWNSFQ